MVTRYDKYILKVTISSANTRRATAIYSWAVAASAPPGSEPM